MTQKLVKARKAHKCDACSQVIEPGEQYWYYVVLPNENHVSGDFWTAKFDQFCDRIMRKAWDECDYGDGVDPWTVVYEYKHELYRENGISDEMNTLDLVDLLQRRRVSGNWPYVESTERAIKAQLADYTGNLIDREAILRALP